MHPENSYPAYSRYRYRRRECGNAESPEIPGKNFLAEGKDVAEENNLQSQISVANHIRIGIEKGKNCMSGCQNHGTEDPRAYGAEKETGP